MIYSPSRQSDTIVWAHYLFSQIIDVPETREDVKFAAKVVVATLFWVLKGNGTEKLEDLICDVITNFEQMTEIDVGQAFTLRS